MSDHYYTTPEDVKMSWARLVSPLQQAAHGHGGEEMTFAVLVNQGIPMGTLEPTYRGREPRGTIAGGNGRLWWPVVRRLQSVGNGARSCIIEISIDLDLQENPCSWRTPLVRNIETK